jgi:hypothetical protein
MFPTTTSLRCRTVTILTHHDQHKTEDLHVSIRPLCVLSTDLLIFLTPTGVWYGSNGDCVTWVVRLYITERSFICWRWFYLSFTGMFVKFTSYKSGKGPPVPIGQKAGWVPEPVWTQKLQEKSFRLCLDRTSVARLSSPYPDTILNELHGS